MNLGSWTSRLVLPVYQDGLLRWLARLVSKRGVSLALIAVIVTVDHTIPWQGMSFVPRALVDEPCAIATALVVLGAITRFRGTPPDPKFGWSMLVWSVLIDIDHLPLEFGSSVLTEGTPRPYFHALWVVALLIAAAVVTRHWGKRAGIPASVATTSLLVGAAWGISAHFLRDAATAPISLWWPVTRAAVQIPYWWYVLALLVIVAVPPVRRRKEPRLTASAPLALAQSASCHALVPGRRSGSDTFTRTLPAINMESIGQTTQKSGSR
jgi:inner membrane protein